jgi:hypothetical protein
MALQRLQTLRLVRSSTGYTQSWTIFWGNPAYTSSWVPVPGDYDGDAATASVRQTPS